jgi:aryl-alcohol dehydrogenase-like predicted oxidoreductase
MRYRTLGTTGVDVSVIGYGSWPLAGHMGAVDQRQATDALRVAIDDGVTLVDTAQGYHDAELLLAPVLGQVGRDKVYLVSKVSRDYAPAAIERAVEASLRRLGTDYLDLYLVHHWPDGYPLEATLETMTRIRERGLVRYLGVSNFDAAQTRQALAIAPIEVVQPRYSMLVREIEAELLPLCREHGLGVLAHSSLAKGLLSGRYDRGATFEPTDERSRMHAFAGDPYARAMDVVDGLRQMAAATGVTVTQLAIAWVLRDPVVTCALVGPKRPDQMREAMAATELELSDEEVAAMSRLADGNEPPLGAFDAGKASRLAE